jgi:hypothetical protein
MNSVNEKVTRYSGGAAAERYGWIVAGSNNSRNGPDVRLNEILSALWQDTHERLAIDDRRVYATGFLAAAQAQSGDRKSALEALRRAVEKGFNDLSRLAQAPEFAALREEKEFKSIIEQPRKGRGQ